MVKRKTEARKITVAYIAVYTVIKKGGVEMCNCITMALSFVHLVIAFVRLWVDMKNSKNNEKRN